MTLEINKYIVINLYRLINNNFFFNTVINSSNASKSIFMVTKVPLHLVPEFYEIIYTTTSFVYKRMLHFAYLDHE